MTVVATGTGTGAGYTRADYQTDQEVRWCPGCGDYTILASVQTFMAGLDVAEVKKENVVFVSGIGCAARFPYYMNTYGFHTIHGRAPAVATGMAIANPDLSVWVVGGDGDMTAIGGNHLIHALRRNVNLKLLLINNQIYGLTKGQYSPTSERGKTTKSSPMGLLDHPFNPVSLALGAEATFVARTLDMDRPHTIAMLEAAFRHQGSALIEIYQNCNVFNDKAFINLTGKQERTVNRIMLRHGEPIVFGPGGEKAVVWEGGAAVIAERAEVDPGRIIVHDARADSPAAAFALSRLSHGPYGPTPLGLFRMVNRPVYDQALESRDRELTEVRGPGRLEDLLKSHGTWTVDAHPGPAPPPTS